MQAFPHRYAAAAIASVEGDVTLEGARLPPLRSASPAEFGGPGDRWSPETLLVASVADCFILTFRAIAGVSRLPWSSLGCDVEGTVDRVERVTQFIAFLIRARLRVPQGTNEEQARRLLERAEQTCIVTNSLKAGVRFECEIEVASQSGDHSTTTGFE
jgi:organic hydroperoxide reductase OsmC/OhrA